MGVNEYFKSQLDPDAKAKQDARDRQNKKWKRSQVKVMSIIDDDFDVAIPQDSDSNYSSQAEINQTHKVLLDKKNQNSERKPG